MSGSESIRCVDFVGIPTRDLDGAVAFYGETLGLPRSVYLPERNPNPIALHVDDVAASRHLLEDRGVGFHGEIIDTGVCHMAIFSDPDGNALMLHHATRRGRPTSNSRSA